MLTAKRGFTLVETLVALVLALIVLAVATGSLLRQQRTHFHLQQLTAADRQNSAAALVLAQQLAQLDRAAGDLVQGEATDTALQFRATIVSALACNTGVSSVTLAPDDTASVTLSSTVATPRTGDSLWWLGDSLWSPLPISAVDNVTATCSSPVPATGSTLRLTFAGADTIPAGSPLRITRQTRYGIYKSSDGTWQLGMREWTSGAFSAPQPAVGPLLRIVAAHRSGFRYFDESGGELPTNGAVDVARVARIRVALLSPLVTREKGQDSVKADSVDIALVNSHVP